MILNETACIQLYDILYFCEEEEEGEVEDLFTQCLSTS